MTDVAPDTIPPTGGGGGDGPPPVAEDRQAELEAVLREAGMFEAPTPSTPPTAARANLDDGEVLALAFAAKNGDEVQRLYEGDAAKFNGDDSAADFALAGHLAFWCGPNAAQIERLMRSSKLAREKWDERRPGPGGTYLAYTIENVLKNQTEFYRPTSRGQSPIVSAHAVDPWRFLTTADLTAAAQTSDIDWVVRGILARGHVTLMPGLWKSGKTTYISHVIKAVGEGGPFCGLDVEPGPVTVISEEGATPWVVRVKSVGLGDYVDFLLRPFPKQRPTINQWITLAEFVADHARERKLVVVDSIHNLWGIEQENDNAEQLRWLEPLHMITDAGAALLLAGHPSKAPQTEGRSTRGGGAIGGWADMIIEFRRYNPDDPHNRMRVLTGFSRFEETPLEMVVELTDGRYRAVGTRAEIKVSLRMENMLATLPATPPGKSAKEIHDEWPGERTPGKRTIETDLATLLGMGRVVRTGAGTDKTDPYRWHRR